MYLPALYKNKLLGFRLINVKLNQAVVAEGVSVSIKRKAMLKVKGSNLRASICIIE